MNRMEKRGLNTCKCIIALCAMIQIPMTFAEVVPLKVLIIDGQNNHAWAHTTPVLKKILEKTGRFQVDVVTSPPGIPRKPRLRPEVKNDPAKVTLYQQAIEKWKQRAEQIKKTNVAKWALWRPTFSAYDVILNNYNGEPWPREVEISLEEYMEQGGGLVSYHAADNSFPDWKAYNKMIGVGGWGGRDETSGPQLRLREGKWIHDTTPGRGGTHGAAVVQLIRVDQPAHPIMRGLPEKWLHVSDELYGKLRGPAENLTVLASSFSDKKNRGTGEQEPVLMVIQYGKGRVFHTVLGHGQPQVKGLGFQITLSRGTEWAATGKVTLPVPTQKLSEQEAVIAQ